jgi:hypothetical protein
MTTPEETAAAGWGVRSTFQTRGAAKRDCPDPPSDGNGGNGGNGGGSGGGSGGDGSGGGYGGSGCKCGCGCGCHQHTASGHQSHCGCAPHCGCGERQQHGQSCSCAHCHRHAERKASAGSRGRSGTTLGWRNPNRPGRHYGITTGRLPGGELDPCDFQTPPWNTWPGTRGDLYLPFLFLRANAGDLGARPVVGPFWESPDVLLLAGVDPAAAPAVPPELGQTALAGQPNTVYAHVWNFGIAAAPNVVVEFYWCDPTLGIGPAGAHLIGYGTLSLGARGSGRSHAVVKCPTAWVPTFLNGGHECLLVRAWDETSDGLGGPPWDAALNRHLGQRNIHVVQSGDGAHALRPQLDAPLPLAGVTTPLTLKVGPLYGEPAQVTVARAAPHAMPWLQLRTGVRGQFPAQAAPTGQALLSPPTSIGGGPSSGDNPGASHQVVGDDQQVAFTTTDAPPGPGEAHVYRVTASQQGQVFGGYTVVLLG